MPLWKRFKVDLFNEADTVPILKSRL